MRAAATGGDPIRRLSASKATSWAMCWHFRPLFGRRWLPRIRARETFSSLGTHMSKSRIQRVLFRMGRLEDLDDKLSD
jgi:hypothetical protein